MQATNKTGRLALRGGTSPQGSILLMRSPKFTTSCVVVSASPALHSSAFFATEPPKNPPQQKQRPQKQAKPSAQEEVTDTPAQWRPHNTILKTTNKPKDQPKKEAPKPVAPKQEAEDKPTTADVSPSIKGDKRNVLIAGATVPGLTLALLLRSRGINADVSEAGETRHPGVTVLNLTARKVFDKLGLSNVLNRNGFEIDRHVESLVPEHGQADFSYRTLSGGAIGQDGQPLLPLAIPTAVLTNILTSFLSQPAENGMSAKQLVRGGPIRAIRKSNNGTAVSFSDGTMKEKEYSLLVATDNPTSLNALPGFKEELYLKKATLVRCPYGVWGVAVDRPASIAMHHQNTSFDIGHLGSRFGIIPFSSSQIYAWGAAPPPRGAPVFVFRSGQRAIQDFPFETFQDFKTYSIPDVVSAIQAIDGKATVVYPRDLRVPKWANNGPEGTADILIGNAAYRMSPLPMHDSSTGIVDAYLLGKRIADTAEDVPLGDAVTGFENERRPQIEELQNWAKRKDKVTSATQPKWIYQARILFTGPMVPYLNDRKEKAALSVDI